MSAPTALDAATVPAALRPAASSPAVARPGDGSLAMLAWAAVVLVALFGAYVHTLNTAVLRGAERHAAPVARSAAPSDLAARQVPARADEAPAVDDGLVVATSARAR
jgi:hypothetical protein